MIIQIYKTAEVTVFLLLLFPNDFLLYGGSNSLKWKNLPFADVLAFFVGGSIGVNRDRTPQGVKRLDGVKWMCYNKNI